MSVHTKLKNNRETILKVASEHVVRNVKLFGSIARLEDEEESDIDLLVSIGEGRSLFDLIRFKNEVEHIMDRNVDVVTEAAIHPSMKDQILHEARSL